MIELAPSEVHVWQFRLDARVDDHALSFDEHERAQRLKIPLARSRFIAGRVQLREMLSQYLGITPADIRFTYTSDGKPLLAADGKRETSFSAVPTDGLHFNLAHSNDYAIAAVARFAVGVDIEQIRPISALQHMMNTVFTPHERQSLEQITSEERKKLAFFRLWTCKEAVMKALGGGFKLAHQIDIALHDSGLITLNIASSVGQGSADYWSLVELPAPNGYVAAVAGANPHLTLRFQNTL